MGTARVNLVFNTTLADGLIENLIRGHLQFCVPYRNGIMRATSGPPRVRVRSV